MNFDDFFKQATLKICGNLEIEHALFSALHFLRKYMPVDRMFLEHYDQNLDSMRTIAIATVREGKTADLLTPLSAEAKRQAERKYHLKSRGVYLFEKAEDEKLAREMLQFHNVKASSLMVLPLESGGKMLGTLAVVSEGDSLFTQRHADLIALLKEPFTVAMWNALTHREVVKLKDLLAEDNRYLHRQLHNLAGDEIVGANFGLRDVMEKVRLVATLDSPVLLLGETGVGKDVIANAIHYSSHRKDGPFIKVNCGAIPETLLDSELFGHEKGAFTGAFARKRGRFERANDGTILLDEIGELNSQAQVRLLRVLQDREIERVGGHQTIQLNIRIIAATNRNLESLVKNNQFREDLWFRLNVFPIWIPPLRQRKSDIPALLQHFIAKKSRELKLPEIPEPARGTVEKLMKYDWPGNIRELENVVERALILHPGQPITFKEFNLDNDIKREFSSTEGEGFENLDAVVIQHIKRVLLRTDGKINGSGGAAEILGINPSTLRNRMKKLGIKFGRHGR